LRAFGRITPAVRPYNRENYSDDRPYRPNHYLNANKQSEHLTIVRPKTSYGEYRVITLGGELLH